MTADGVSISETTFNLASLERAIMDADLCPLRVRLDGITFANGVGTSPHQTRSTSPPAPTAPISHNVPTPRYVITKAYRHRSKVDQFNDFGHLSHQANTSPVQHPIQPQKEPTRSSSKRKRSDSSHLEAAPSNTIPKTRPVKALPKVTPGVVARVALTTAPHTLPSLPKPPPPTFAILTDDSTVTLPPPRKKIKARSQDAIQRRRTNQRAKRDAQDRFRGLKDIWIKHLARTKVLILTNFDIADMPCGTGGWRGSSRRTYHSPRTLQEAMNEGFRQLEWDGLETIAILDCQRRLIILLRKRDMSKEGLERQERMTEALRKASEKALLSKKTGGKGDFYALREGIVHATGTPIPLRVDNLVTNRRILAELLNNPDFVYEARQSDITWRIYNPDMHSTYWDIREAISMHPDCEHLKFNFEELPFALTTFNFGPQTICETHIDDTDNAYGWAPLRAFGPYNYRTGGHIVFPTLRLLIQFPQGAEAWFPTALFPHANIQIGEDEIRYSVTSYSSGGLSEFVYRGGNSKRGWMRYLKEYSMADHEAGQDAERPALLVDRMFPKWQ
ncbi:hypothetical protein CYLTODRAFT_226913 [Cylindrobasidium torrendii FP15055 ss-10]|uniref:Uncharacterized protein n=1 Tax=Cylindrobasidium torrendii FP15055 ss-10 TaxID=1314674 RepID=A0A0D7BH41_9AGAR|nr:hypothetical protein CYLTODRAFT_226913 [Cylindrobasidium torrendii FP15055 ss-10]